MDFSKLIAATAILVWAAAWIITSDNSIAHARVQSGHIASANAP